MSDTGTKSSAPAGRLTQAERRDRSERELLSAAIRVVGQQGVSAATFDAIGKEAGFSRVRYFNLTGGVVALHEGFRP